MKTKEIAERLASLCAEAKMQTSAGRILVPARPVDLIEELLPFLDDREREGALWNGFAHMARRSRSIGWRSLLQFCWDERESSIDLLTVEGLSFVALPVDEDGTAERVIARFDPEVSGDLVAAFLLDVARSNGEEYGFELFDVLPDEAIDRVGLPYGAIEDAYRAWTHRQETSR
ncbi:MAG TPA: hypothetical protein VM638_05135 [Actinomycetota bacterium]|nr:hypothetical protein [Actinomycetota bacterium]